MGYGRNWRMLFFQVRSVCLSRLSLGLEVFWLKWEAFRLLINGYDSRNRLIGQSLDPWGEIRHDPGHLRDV